METISKFKADTAAVVWKSIKPLCSYLTRNGYIIFGGTIIVIALLVALFAPYIVPMDPDQINPATRLEPIGSEGHPLGSDHLGRDMLSRLIWGSRLTILAGVGAAGMAMLAGVSVGLISGTGSSGVDNILMRFIDVLMAFPAILLAILIVAFLGPGIQNAMLAVAIVNVPFYARLTRSVTLSIKEKEFIEASLAIGNSKLKTIFKHVIPNISPYILVQSMMNIGWMITETASLSFLGLGAQPPRADWGSMLGEARSVMIVAPTVVALPGLCIFMLVLGFNLTGDGLRDRFDPKMKER